VSKMIVTDANGKEHLIDAKEGVSVMETLREQDFGVAAICGGMCSCATCHVWIDSEWMAKLPPIHGDEVELIRELDSYKPQQSRLSCQVPFTAALDGLRLTIAPDE